MAIVLLRLYRLPSFVSRPSFSSQDTCCAGLKSKKTSQHNQHNHIHVMTSKVGIFLHTHTKPKHPKGLFIFFFW